jgi:hypothetical protein
MFSTYRTDFQVLIDRVPTFSRQSIINIKRKRLLNVVTVVHCRFPIADFQLFTFAASQIGIGN